VSAGGSIEGTARVWGTADGALVATHYYERRVLRAATDWSGKNLATCSVDDTIQLWRTREDTPPRLLRGGDGVADLDIAPDGSMLAAGCRDGSIHFWRVRDAQAVGTQSDHGTCVSSVAFSPDGQLLVSGWGDQTIRIWSVRDMALVATWDSTGGEVMSTAWSRDSTVLATGTMAGRIQVWDLGKGVP